MAHLKFIFGCAIFVKRNTMFNVRAKVVRIKTNSADCKIDQYKNQPEKGNMTDAEFEFATKVWYMQMGRERSVIIPPELKDSIKKGVYVEIEIDGNDFKRIIKILS